MGRHARHRQRPPATAPVRRRAIGGVLALLAGITPVPATTPSAAPAVVLVAAAASPNPSPGAGPRGGPDEGQPTSQEAAAQARARRLGEAADVQRGELDAARAELLATARVASAALEQYRAKVLARQQAQAELLRRQQHLADAQRGLDEQRAELGRWARAAYTGGSALADDPLLATLLADGHTDDPARMLAWVTRAGNSRGRAVTALARALATQAVAARDAELAAAAAQQAAEAAAETKATRDRAVQAQRRLVEQAQDRLGATQDAQAQATQEAQRLARARRIAAAPNGPGGTEVTGPVGSCAGGDLTGYGNGLIPRDLLCPLWGAPGQALRADAAFAFNQLSEAYARQFGRPVCVTDSYRTYPEQVAVYARRPDLAAVPGTSNHGWGTALDLCGGIERFGTGTHEWMLANAPAFGWFHPGWAGPGGSRPEPWHWEFGG